jgi:hypothetical protein
MKSEERSTARENIWVLYWPVWTQQGRRETGVRTGHAAGAAARHPRRRRRGCVRPATQAQAHLVVSVDPLGIQQHEVVLAAVGGHALHGSTPHPEALCAGAVRRPNLKPAAAAQQLVQDVRLPLPRPSSHRYHAHGTSGAAQHGERFGPHLEFTALGIVAHKLQRTRPVSPIWAAKLRSGRGRGRSPGSSGPPPEPTAHPCLFLVRRRDPTA